MEKLEDRRLLAGDLRITEVNYNPHPSMTQFGERDADSDDYEFIEVANVGDAPLNLEDYQFIDGVEFTFDRQVIQPGEHLVIVQDPREFTFRYGLTPELALGDGGNDQDPGEFSGSLRNSGELITLVNPRGIAIQQFTFFDTGEWPSRADGGGSSLEVIDPLGDLNDPKNWRPSAEYGGSPGRAGEGHQGDIVINELLTHTDLPDVDTIELANRTGDPIDVSGWYITDSVANPFRYRLPVGTEIDSDDYLSLDEVTMGFSFRGQEADNAFVIEPDDRGRPIRFVDAVSYGATQNGITLGRWNDRDGELFPMIFRTFDDENSGPLIGEIVISEVHYNPLPAGGARAADLEFVEITNRSGIPIDVGEWQLSQSVEFTVPAGFVLAANSSMVVVGFDPFVEGAKARQFLDNFAVADNIALFGPFSDANDPNPDSLDDNGETLVLQRPEDIEQLGLGYVLVDRVMYRDSGEWPAAADGNGRSLTRNDLESYGDFASSWRAAIPTPGTQTIVGDVSGDGLVDDTDIDQICLALSFGAGPEFDINADGVVNENDVSFLIGDVLGSVIGDSNLDGVFNSSDFVAIFRAGEYEDGIARNSGWAEGDWNCDGEFNSTDIVDAFTAGTYTADAVANAVAARNDIEKPRGTFGGTSDGERIQLVDQHEAERRKAVLDVKAIDSLFAA